MEHRLDIRELPISALLDDRGTPRAKEGAQRVVETAKWYRSIGGKDAFDVNKVGVLTVIQNGVGYFITDGRHRATELLSRGFKVVTCEVKHDLTPEETFLSSNAGLPVTNRDKWRVMLSGGMSPVVEITRLVESRGYSVSLSHGNDPYQFACYSALMSAYLSGKLDRCLTALDQLAGDLCEGWVLGAMEMFFRLHPEADAKRLGEKMREWGPARFEMVARATAAVNGTRKTAVYQTMVTAYNHRLRTGKLKPI